MGANRMKLGAVSLLSVLAGLQPSFGFETQWRWVHVAPHDNAADVTWKVEQGEAKNVTISGSQFMADLYPSDLPIHPKTDPVVRLNGTISGSKITATAIYVGTDADKETYHGNVRIVKPRDTSLETDRVTLMGEWADGFIGLIRVKSSIKP